MHAAGVPYVPPPTINSSLVVDKVLVGERVTLKCFIHLPAGSAAGMSWTSNARSQVSPTCSSIELVFIPLVDDLQCHFKVIPDVAFFS